MQTAESSKKRFSEGQKLQIHDNQTRVLDSILRFIFFFFISGILLKMSMDLDAPVYMTGQQEQIAATCVVFPR